MAKQNEKNAAAQKSSASRRSRSGRAGKGGTIPRIMVLGLLVIVAGGAALFWPRGGTVPTGIGENQTVVSSPVGSPDAGSTPHSGDVDINDAGPQSLTPEKPKEAAAQAPAEKTSEVVTKTAEPVKKPAAKPATKKPVAKTTKPDPEPAPKIAPASSGPYAVQVGAFGMAENADQEAARLKAKGWDARVRAGNNSSGDMVFRVWIGFFASRNDAQTFIDQNKRDLAGAIPVHR